MTAPTSPGGWSRRGNREEPLGERLVRYLIGMLPPEQRDASDPSSAEPGPATRIRKWVVTLDEQEVSDLVATFEKQYRNCSLPYPDLVVDRNNITPRPDLSWIVDFVVGCVTETKSHLSKPGLKRHGMTGLNLFLRGADDLSDFFAQVEKATKLPSDEAEGLVNLVFEQVGIMLRKTRR
jgi:hypothetical protein